MLISFHVENFRSIRDQVELSLIAANDRALRENVIESKKGSKLSLLRSAVIYGPNASGKSNVLRAIRFMAGFVYSSATGKPNAPIGVSVHKLDKKYLKKPSRFALMFLSEGVRFSYSFSVNAKQVIEESLSYYPVGQERRLFDRTFNKKTGETDYYFGPSWEGPKKQLQELTRPNALLLSVGAQFNHEQCKQVYSWFSEKLRSVSWFPTQGSEKFFTCESAHSNEAMKHELLKFWKQADPGIADFSVEKMTFEKTPSLSKLPDALRRELIKSMPEDAFDFDVKTTHSAPGLQADFTFDEESHGTQKMFALAGPWLYALAHGCILIVDELDARLHPLLTRWLIDLFHNKKTNKSGAQLIFATHDTNLLDRREQNPHFRRDQIWFTEKDERGGTRLYSLWDFEKPPRKDENIRLGYLAGRYDAIPFTESLSQ